MFYLIYQKAHEWPTFEPDCCKTKKLLHFSLVSLKYTYEKPLKMIRIKNELWKLCQHCLEVRLQIYAFLLPYVVKNVHPPWNQLGTHPKIVLAPTLGTETSEIQVNFQEIFTKTLFRKTIKWVLWMETRARRKTAR